MGIFLLAISSKDLIHDQEIELIEITPGFVFEGLKGRRGKGTFAGEKEAAIVWGEEVVEFGLGEAKRGLTFGREWPLPDLELSGVFGVEGGFEELFVGEDFQSAFEGRGGDMGRVTEVIVAHRAGA